LRKKLEALDTLQEIDLKIDGQQVEKQGLVEKVDRLEAQIEESRSAIALKTEDRARLEDAKATLEENLEIETDNIARSEVRLKEIKTQKEYQAVSKEIASAKKLKAEIEEQILQTIAQAESIAGEIAEKESRLGELTENIAGQKAELQALIDKIEGDIAVDNAAKETAVQSLPSSVVRRYTMLREQRRGVAVVEARDGICLGCNMNLPPQLYNSLFRCDDLVTCPHCQRMLILRQVQGV
jgi:predicted  nucleic acid-binding Zn-ribbon protein